MIENKNNWFYKLFINEAKAAVNYANRVLATSVIISENDAGGTTYDFIIK